MSYEDIYIVVNLESIDAADMMIMDEDQKDNILGSDYVSALLEAYGLSFDALEGSSATLHNKGRKLYIRIEENQAVFPVTLLERMDLRKYIRFATSFDFPKRVKLYDVSSQVGGIIDTNFGIKFKIKLLNERADPILLEQKADREDIRTEEDYSAKMFIKAMQGIAEDDRDYDGAIDDILKQMYHFYSEGMNQIRHARYNQDPHEFHVIHRKGNMFFFGVCEGEYYAVAYVEDQYYLAYRVKEDGEIEILCNVKDLSNVCQCIEDHNKNMGAL